MKPVPPKRPIPPQPPLQGYAGEIRLFAGPFAPKAWRYCAGETLAIAEYTMLYVVVGAKFGGDGMSTFALPSLADPVPGVKYIVCIEGTYPRPA